MKVEPVFVHVTVTGTWEPGAPFTGFGLMLKETGAVATEEVANEATGRKEKTTKIVRATITEAFMTRYTEDISKSKSRKI